MVVEFMKQDINRARRQYFIERVNRPISKSLSVLRKTRNTFIMLWSLVGIAFSIKKYPRPTLINCYGPNTKLLLRTLDKYMEYEEYPAIAVAVELLVTLLAVKNEHSPNYRDRISWWAEELAKGWKPRALNHPQYGWGEPKPYGGGR